LISDRVFLRACASAASLLVTVSACEIEKVGIPPTESMVSLHGVLSASAPSQVVLLERTRNGTVRMFAPPFDLADPIVSDEGVAESGAIVTLTTPDGQTLTAVEDSRTRDDRKGEGIYRFSLSGSALIARGNYQLSVRTTGGEALAAETSVPAGAAVVVAEQATFDRSRDTVVYEWPESPGARSYFVRIETPFGPRSFFTDSTRVRLPGGLRNVDVTVLPHIFIPGFPQAVTVSAVDSNYYDWYRTHNDALSGSGLVNRVRGGIGVFGSLVRLKYVNYEVVAPQTEAIAGTFAFVGTQLEAETTPYLALHLYVESPSSRSDQGDALSGRFERRPTFTQPNEPIDGLLGTVQSGKVELSFLRNWSSTDTVEVFRGELRGDTLVGSYRGFGGVARFVKQR
jgi:uncharacterized protein DUF4249